MDRIVVRWPVGSSPQAEGFRKKFRGRLRVRNLLPGLNLGESAPARLGEPPGEAGFSDRRNEPFAGYCVQGAGGGTSVSARRMGQSDGAALGFIPPRFVRSVFHAVSSGWILGFLWAGDCGRRVSGEIGNRGSTHIGVPDETWSSGPGLGRVSRRPLGAFPFSLSLLTARRARSVPCVCIRPSRPA